MDRFQLLNGPECVELLLQLCDSLFDGAVVAEKQAVLQTGEVHINVKELFDCFVAVQRPRLRELPSACHSSRIRIHVRDS